MRAQSGGPAVPAGSEGRLRGAAAPGALPVPPSARPRTRVSRVDAHIPAPASQQGIKGDRPMEKVLLFQMVFRPKQVFYYFFFRLAWMCSTVLALYCK